MNSDVHCYNTRHKNEFRSLKVNHEFARKCIRYDIPVIVNNLPASLLSKVHSHSIKNLMHTYKQMLIRSYKENCTLNNCWVCRNLNAVL